MSLVALKQPDTTLTLSREQTVVLDPDLLFDINGIEGSVVELQFAGPFGIPPLYFELYDRPGLAERTTKKTAKNFLNYVNQGLYNGSIIHRAVPDFIIQGGGFSVADGVSPIESLGPLKNEPGNSNVRGTVAMAKIGGDPNSATNQWFINLNDNSANLDEQNGGFTVFGEVLGSGMEIADAISQGEIIPATDINPAFNELPVWRDETNQPYFFLIANARQIERESQLMFFDLDSDDPTSINAQINDEGNIELTLLQSLEGPTTLTLEAFSGLDGASVEQSYTIEGDIYSTRAKIKGSTSAATPAGLQTSGRLKAKDTDGLTGETIYSIEDNFNAINGTATIDPKSGRWTYKPNQDFSGSDGFVVTVTDDLGGTTVQNIAINVTPLIDGTKQKDDLTGTELPDWIRGKAGNDRLSGQAGDDVLDGGKGKDILSGGEGADTLSGRGGRDTFRLESLKDSTLKGLDHITDFQTKQDQIDAPEAIDSASIIDLGTIKRPTNRHFKKVFSNVEDSQSSFYFAPNTAAILTTTAANSQTLLVINDDKAGFNANKDAVIDITGFTGNINNLAII